jgi:hypothetical protein
MGIYGCASDPKDIEAQYVSTSAYQDFDCEQISAESRRVSRRVSELFRNLDEIRSTDETQMAVGMILVWPALFFLEGGDGPQAAEYARLKGEIDALETVAIAKDCDMTEFEMIREKEREMREATEAAKKAEEYDPLNPE